MPNPILILNQPQVNIGLNTLTYTVGPTGLYSVLVSATFPSTAATGAGAGSGADQGLGATGGFPGSSAALQTLSNGQTGLGTAFPNVAANAASGVALTTPANTTPNLPSTSLGSGAQGLGFGGTENDNASGNGNGYGAGAGGGDVSGFARGGNGVGNGGVGQGFGAVPNNYNQPSANAIVPTSVAGLTSSLSVVINQNGSPIYTSTAPTPTQGALQFKFGFVGTAADTITVVFSSSNANDKTLEAVQSTTTIQQGL